jgi:hypothetical protein
MTLMNGKNSIFNLLAGFCAIIICGTCHAIPTWIGVTSDLPRQDGGNPGTFTVLMNQSYTTLHASVGISINGSSWHEYSMTYAEKDSKNWRWTYKPQAVFPSGATIRYYFRGWDDAGGSILDGSSGNPYSFFSIAPSLTHVAGAVGSMTSIAPAFPSLTWIVAARIHRF